jgi:7-keto-8-aminopelargonate synthetase-like enzyme
MVGGGRRNRGTHVTTTDKKDLVNMAAFNFLGLAGDPTLAVRDARG